MTSADSPDEALRIKSGKTKYLWVVGAVAYLGFLSYIGWADIHTALTELDYPYLVAYATLNTAILWLPISKWHIALHGGHDITRLAFLSKAGGNLPRGALASSRPYYSKSIVHQKQVPGFCSTDSLKPLPSPSP